MSGVAGEVAAAAADDDCMLHSLSCCEDTSHIQLRLLSLVNAYSHHLIGTIFFQKVISVCDIGGD